MDTTLLIGIAGSIFTGVSLLPQLVKLIKEKKASDISMLMLGTLFTGLAIWVWYGFRIHDWVIVISNLFSLTVNAFIVALNINYTKKEGQAP